LGAAALPGDRPLAGLAALGGSGLLAAVQLLLGWCLWRCCTVTQRRPWIAATVAAVLLSHGLGAALLLAAPAEGRESERVLVLQPAIPTRQKFAWAQQQRLQQRLAAALVEARQRGASVVLLPEGALGLEPQLGEGAAVELIGGGFHSLERAGEPEQRSALLRFAQGERQASSQLDKHRLVPLGEWVPLAGLIRWSGLSAVGGLQPGPPSRLLPRPAGAIAGAICYELSDGAALATATREGAGWLLASANLDPYPLMLQQQFQAQAQLRAIETGRWLVSAANTGPSLLVNARGEVVASLPPGRAATGVFDLPRLRGLTPYDRWGEAPLLLLLAGAGVRRWR
jgi:apolipoprotein N-acyltransferase